MRRLLLEPSEQALAHIPGSLDDHFDATVRKIAGRPLQTELERLGPNPPAEANGLDLPVHERGEAYGVNGLVHRPKASPGAVRRR